MMKENRNTKTQTAVKKGRPIKIALSVIAAVLVIVYCYFVYYFAEHYYWHTKINGMKVGAKTAEEAKKMLEEETNEYLLTIHDRDGKKYHIKGTDIDYEYESTGEEEDLLDAQNAFLWPARATKKHNLTLKVSTNYDAAKLQQQIAALDCFKEENITHPENAYIQTEDHKFELVKEVQGNELLPQETQEAIQKALETGKTELTLTDDVYKKPEVTAKDKTLTACMKEIKKYTDSSVVYDIPGYDEKADADTIASWLDVGEDYSVTLNETALAAYVQSLASKYNTYGRERQFNTTMGGTVTIGGGDYGFIVDKEKEAEQLKADITTGKQIKREPIYAKKAQVRDGSYDIGSTYIEVDYTNQHFWYYKEGNVVYDADIVSGDVTKTPDQASPDGIFTINTKETDKTMYREGPNGYTTHTKFFLQIASNVGFHDADDWRQSYGGSIYRGNGSHGCLNVSLKTVQWLYDNVEIGTPVIAFYRSKMKLTSYNNKMCNAYSTRNQEEETEGNN